MPRPHPDETASYYHGYIDLVPDGAIVATLDQQGRATQELLAQLGETQAEHRYAAGKWNVKEVLGHIADVERVFAFRALWFARGERGPLPSLDQDVCARHARFAERQVVSIAAELAAVRAASVTLFASLDEAANARTGVASGCPFTVRAIPWIIAGHELHHVAVLRDRYGVQPRPRAASGFHQDEARSCR
jgi:uncharacterized damage-inducible protein DinB